MEWLYKHISGFAEIDLSIVKVPLFYSFALLVSVSDAEQWLRIFGLILTILYTGYKFISDYRKNKTK